MAHHLSFLELFWLGVGFFGQALFGMRFLVQWIYSEKHRKSMVPITFWWFSISGGVILLIYAIYKRDLVFISGQLFGLIVYMRNIWLIYDEQKLKTQQTSISSIQ
ncbi:MAG: lipid-A-disaccharide synthase N-terminal domain-containing protein [Proteobacteria bacterium]|nr:lipid-A-disaccharide synthase N-terminal domain-containing protein [Pseudomonadota bacterium]